LSKASTSSIALVDVEHLSFELGIINWDDPHTYNLCKQPFSMDALPQVADAVAAVAQGLLGKARKVLVLDLDNTVWGGVIGDDGIDGIQLGPETPEGEAFTHFQQYVNKLRQRGIVLAVCSKNRHEVAEEAFYNHPAMVLKAEHIGSFVANFKDKPSNLKQISRELNLGLDSFVFVDDSPVERELMRMKLPEVLTIEMPEDPALYVQTLERCRVFPMANLTADDLNRANSYKLRSQAKQAYETATDMESFLKELQTTATIERFGDSTKDRVVQLIAKTNQFKLNPNQFTPKELMAKNREVLCIRLKDRLQDYGIVAVAVLSIVKNRLRIENWVMSCRVFSRRLEYLTFDLVVEQASKHGINEIDLAYIPSAKNALVYDLLEALNFKEAGLKNQFSTSVQKFKENVNLLPHHIRVVK
jgi:FkbH-like protein